MALLIARASNMNISNNIDMTYFYGNGFVIDQIIVVHIGQTYSDIYLATLELLLEAKDTFCVYVLRPKGELQETGIQCNKAKYTGVFNLTN